MNGQKWTDSEVERLIKLYKANHDFPVIAERLGRTRPAVHNKINELRHNGRMDRKARPPKPAKPAPRRFNRNYPQEPFEMGPLKVPADDPFSAAIGDRRFEDAPEAR